MTDLTSNERAFIKVAVDLRQQEEGLKVLKAVRALGKRLAEAEAYYSSGIQHYDRHGHMTNSTSERSKVICDRVKNVRNCSEEAAGFLPLLNFLGGNSGQDIEQMIKKVEEKIIELRGLVDVYCRGEDMVVWKLTQVKEEVPK